MLYFFLFSYIFGGIAATVELREKQFLTNGDVLMFFLAPFNVIPVLSVFLLSQFIDLKAPFTKD